VLNCPYDREAAGKPGRVPGGEHRQADPETGGEPDRAPGQAEPESGIPSGEGDHDHPGDNSGEDPEDRPGDAEDARLHDDGAPDLTDRHPRRPQHADLPDPLQDVHRERVYDPQGGHDDRDDRQRVEQPEDSPERGVDGAGHPIEWIRLEGERSGRLLASRPGS
jgi:hypothetical protein